jgi:protein arginine kinase activator
VSDKEAAGKKCDHCGASTAVVHLTQVVNNEITTSHLCEDCAAQKGLQTEGPPDNLPLTDFLAKLGGDVPSSSGDDDEDRVCPFCDLSAKEFKEVGRLGCPQCYSTFETHLRGLLRRVHGSTVHVGKVYLPPDPTVSERENRLEALGKKLQRAVDTEDFERAAELRDEIRALEPAL